MARNTLFIAFLISALIAPSVRAMEMGPGSSMPGMNTTTTSSEPCIAMPSMPNCTDYTYPTSNATADITSLCNAMPFMTGCSISNICATGGSSSLALQSGGYCNPISLLADTCKSDTGMSKMSGCKSYNSMCNMTAGSVVSACTKYPPVPGLPTTMAVNAAVKSICTEMSMSGCEKCSWAGNVTFANCDLLSVYSSLCTQMPTMSQCSAFPGMCSSGALGQTGLCTTQSDSSSDAVNMLMYFHAGIRDYFLFYQWVPKNTGEFFGSLVAVFFIAVTNVGLSIFRDRLATKAHQVSKAAVPPTVTSRLQSFSLRFVGTFFALGCAYILMLLVMNYNVWVFLAAILGLATGEGVLGAWRVDERKEVQEVVVIKSDCAC